MSKLNITRNGALIARVLLALIFIIFGLNFFLHFITAPPPEGNSGAFVGGLFQSHYFFPFLKGLEIILGLLLLFGMFVPLVLVVLMPISLNILLFHGFLLPSGIGIGIAIIALHLFLAWSYRGYYKELFISRAIAG